MMRRSLLVLMLLGVMVTLVGGAVYAEETLLFKDTFAFWNGSYNINGDYNWPGLRQTGSLGFIPWNEPAGIDDSRTQLENASAPGELLISAYQYGGLGVSPNHNFVDSNNMKFSVQIRQVDDPWSVGTRAGLSIGNSIAPGDLFPSHGLGITVNTKGEYLVLNNWNEIASSATTGQTFSGLTHTVDLVINSDNGFVSGPAYVSAYIDGVQVLDRYYRQYGFGANYVTLMADNYVSYFDNFTVTSINTVPEPASLIVLLGGCLGLVAKRRSTK